MYLYNTALSVLFCVNKYIIIMPCQNKKKDYGKSLALILIIRSIIHASINDRIQKIDMYSRKILLTYITLSNSIIIEVIKEPSPNTAGGPGGIPASLLMYGAE